MNVLFVSNLFPNQREPSRGMYNAQQIAALAQLCQVKVIAPTDQAMPNEMRDGVAVVHPRFCHAPLLSRPFNGWLFARAVQSEIRHSQFDIALVNWAYPDAYGVMLVAEKLGFPFATTVQGSDVNVFFDNPTRKRQILQALRASRAVFTRSHALRDRLAAAGITATTVYNGIDRDKFHPRDRVEACAKLGLDPKRKRILYVGNLLPVKGPTVLKRAAEQLPDVDVMFVGAGAEKVGARPHDEIPWWMNASDVLCLPSLNEGLPNVALEALACGIPVVASRVGGVPEIVQDGVNGLLVPPGDSHALADALRAALTKAWDKSTICRSVAAFDWNVNARTVAGALEQIVANGNPKHSPSP